MTGTQNPDPTTLLPALTGTWTLDPAASAVELHTKAMWGMVKVKGSFKLTEGTGTVGADGSVTGTLVVDAASVDTKQAKRDHHLRGTDFFDVDQYPTFVYTAESAQPEPGGVAIQGNFTAHGQTHPLSVHGTATPTGSDKVTLVVESDLNRGEWGIDFSKMGARLDNHIVITAVFTRS